MEIPNVTLLEDAFKGEPSKSSKFEVTILKKYSDDKFLITDDSDHCTLRSDPHKELYKYLLTEKNKLRIINPKVNISLKELEIESTTSVVVIKRFSNEVVSPNGNSHANESESENDTVEESDDESEENSQ